MTETTTIPMSEELKKTQRELAILYEVSNAMRTTLELNHILYIILTGVTAHTGLGFNRAILFLVNHNDRTLEPRMAIGPESGEHAQKIWDYVSKYTPKIEDLIQSDAVLQNSFQSALYDSVKGLKIPLANNEQNLLASAYHRGVPVHITREKINEFAADPLLQIFKTNELIIMPLKAKDKVNGLIVADNIFTQKVITDDDLKMFTMLANQAGLAIENSQLYELIRQKSRLDSLTNLWNHGFFQDQLSHELQLAQIKNEPLCLAMIDIDNFKKLNDSYGHQNGDLVLKELANVLKQLSRNHDYPCRYGGEEFSLILPRTRKEEGMTIAERIRQKIEEHRFPNFSPDINLKVTVSIGVASFSEDAQSKEELIAMADKAMYISKFSGKNQTSVPQRSS